MVVLQSEQVVDVLHVTEQVSTHSSLWKLPTHKMCLDTPLAGTRCEVSSRNPRWILALSVGSGYRKVTVPLKNGYSQAVVLATYATGNRSVVTSRFTLSL